MDSADETHLVEMASGGRIALYRFSAETTAPPLIITHGTISNGNSVLSLCNFLNKAGYDCWLLEWGGHGQSVPARKRQNFEHPAFNDVPTAIDHVLANTHANSLTWVSHSGGGLLPLMYLGKRPERQADFASIVTMGAQTTDAAMRMQQKLAIGIFWLINLLVGHTPRAILPKGYESEPTQLLGQWATWALREKWLGAQNFNYLTALRHITVPILMIAGGADTIAPASGCRKLYEAIGSTNKTWLLCAKAAGFSRDYTHGQLVLGRAARAEIFPKVADWLVQFQLEQQADQSTSTATDIYRRGSAASHSPLPKTAPE